MLNPSPVKILPQIDIVEKCLVTPKILLSSQFGLYYNGSEAQYFEVDFETK